MHCRKFYKTQENKPSNNASSKSLQLPQQTAVEKLESQLLQELESREISIHYADIVDLVEQGCEQLYLYKLHEELKIKATEANYTYIEPLFPATKEDLEALQLEILEGIVLHKINQYIAKTKEITGWTPDPPKFDAELPEKEEHLFLSKSNLVSTKISKKQLFVLPPRFENVLILSDPHTTKISSKLKETSIITLRWKPKKAQIVNGCLVCCVSALF